MSVPLTDMKGYMPRYIPDRGARYMPDRGARYMPDRGAGTVSSSRSTIPSEVIFSASA